MSPNRLISTYPHQLLCSLLLVLLGLLGASLHLYHSQVNRAEQLSLLGDNLAQQTSLRVADPALIEDLVSLQIILREMVQGSPLVRGAAIYDAEEQLLVQSGDTGQPGESSRFDAPIVLQDHIAGTVWLTLDSPAPSGRQWALYWAWPSLSLLLALFPWLLLIAERRRAARIAARQQNELAYPEQDSPPTPTAAVRLSLYLPNLGRLYSQLNSTGFRQLMDSFETQLHSVLNLYGGQRQLLWDQVLIVDFSGDQPADCSFRAICASQLLFNLNAHRSGPKLQLAASVQALPEPASPANAEEEFVAQYSERRAPDAGEILVAARLADSQLLHYAQIDSSSGLVQTVNPPYCDMLHKQEQRLSDL